MLKTRKQHNKNSRIKTSVKFVEKLKLSGERVLRRKDYNIQLCSEEPSKKKLEIKLVYDQNIWSVYSSLVKNTGWFVGDVRAESGNIKWNNESTILCITNK